MSECCKAGDENVTPLPSVIQRSSVCRIELGAWTPWISSWFSHLCAPNWNHLILSEPCYFLICKRGQECLLEEQLWCLCPLADVVFRNLGPSFGILSRFVGMRLTSSSRERGSCLSHLASSLRTHNLFSFPCSTQYPTTAQPTRVNRILGFWPTHYLPLAPDEDFSAEKAREPWAPASGKQVASQTMIIWETESLLVTT